MNKLLYKEESAKIVGAIFEVRYDDRRDTEDN